jgi:hypothetical protein
LETPIVLFIFKRPAQTAKVLQAILAANPVRLYVIADGPRNAEEAALCRQTRDVISTMRGDCELRMLYADKNMGLRGRIVSGLDWVFSCEDRAIIFEDDCLPHPEFFTFCEDLLEYYQREERVMHISGNNFLLGRISIKESYYFSKYAHCWGWATWRRAWKLFHAWDVHPKDLHLDFQIFMTKTERDFWVNLLKERKTSGQDIIWDYQWSLICMAKKALCIMPRVNLVSNIGFSPDATNTIHPYWYANLPTEPISFPLHHPSRMAWNSRADEIDGTIFFEASMTRRARFKNMLKGIFVKRAKKK